MTEVAAEVLPGHADGRIGVLTGPNIATEVAAGMPTASVVAMGDTTARRMVQRLFMTDTFRVYTNPDVVGCEIAGVVKNVVALAAGIAQGLGVGDNARAALITRGLAELTRFGLALGGNPLSFLGLAGIGDIVVTCTSPRSRNRSVGEALGRGRPLADVLGRDDDGGRGRPQHRRRPRPGRRRRCGDADRRAGAGGAGRSPHPGRRRVVAHAAGGEVGTRRHPLRRMTGRA